MNRFLSLAIQSDDIKLIRKAALWLSQFTPRIGLEQRELILDLTGTERVNNGEDTVTGRIIGAFKRKGIPARCSIAPTIGAAWAIAHFTPGPITIVRDEPLKEVLAPLPIEALRIEKEAAISLRELGITKIGDILKLHPKTLGIRFGYRLLGRLDQALGRAEEAFVPLRIQERLTARRRFEIPLTRHDSVSAILLRLFNEVFFKLERIQRKAGTFILRCNGRVVRELSLYAASQDKTHLQSVIQPIVESLRIPEGITEIDITVCNLKRLNGTQSALRSFETRSDESSRVNEKLGELINNLSVRLGEGNVAKAVFHDSYIPENSFSFRAVKDEGKIYPSLVPVDRPPYLLEQPQPIEVIAMLPDHPPAWFRWDCERFKTVTGIGPERIAAEWWKKDLSEALSARDYFKIQDHTGRWLWIFRDQKTQSWFVHGVWL